jgi:hypothetical protein
MDYFFSRHALEQAKNRNILERFIKEVVENPGKIIDYDECIKIYQSIIKLEKPYLLRVFINTCKEPWLIITVYKTSKIEKYHES